MTVLWAGIDQNGNGWVKWNNIYYYSPPEIKAAASPNNAPQQSDKDNYAAWVALYNSYAAALQLHKINSYTFRESDITMGEIIGFLRLAGVPFTAYVPPPAPTPVVTAETVTSIPSYKYPTLYTGGPFGPEGRYRISDPYQGSGGTWTIDIFDTYHPEYEGLYKFYFDPASNAWLWNGAPLAVQPKAPVSLLKELLAGYTTLPPDWVPRAAPLYGQAPVMSPDGTSSFSGAAQFVALVRPAWDTRLSIPASQIIGLDPLKLSAGLYAYEETDLGAIVSPAGRTYELFRVSFQDLVTGKVTGPFYETVEGGGGGIHLEDAAPTILRVATDITTFGAGEIIHAVDSDIAEKVDMVVGGGSIAVVTAVATGGTAIGATGAILATSGGAISGALAQDSVDALTGAIVAGAAVGIGSQIGNAITPEAPATPTLPSNTAPSGSLFSGAQEATFTVPPSTSSSGSLLSSSLGAAQKTLISAGTTLGAGALTTVIKKLTGQLPGAQAPSETINATVYHAAPESGGSGGESINGSKLLLAGVVGLLLFKK